MIKRKHYYLLSLLFVFVIPTMIAGYFVSDRISRDELLVFVLSITLLGSFWDIWATRHGKGDPVWIWTFNRKDTLGIRFFDLPIEEYLFYVVSSTYVVFIWEGIKYALEQENTPIKLILPFLALWPLACIALPYFKKERQDKLR